MDCLLGGWVIIIMSGNLRESLFFKREIAEKAAELLGVLGVDEYLDMEEVEREGEGVFDCEEDDHWQDVTYQVRNPVKPVPPALQKRIMEDYQVAKGHNVSFAPSLVGTQDATSFHWQVRKEQAIVDCFAVVLSQSQGQGQLHQTFAKVVHSKQALLMERIGEVNSQWEYEGVEISSAFPSSEHCQLVVNLRQYSFIFLLCWEQVNADQLLHRLKASIIENMMRKQTFKSLPTTIISPQQLISVIDGLSLKQKICLAYSLNQEYGLTLAIKSMQFSSKILTKSNKLSYRRCIFHITRLCTAQCRYEQQALAIVECQEDEVETAFQQLYLRAVCEK